MSSIAQVYQPIVRQKQGAFSAAALVGTYSVILGWNVEPSFDRERLLGFAIRRAVFDPSTEEMVELDWLKGQKRFENVPDDHGLEIRSDLAPFQRFRWSDYTVNPNSSYRYTIFPMVGVPGQLKRLDPLEVNLRPAAADDQQVGVYVNRGVTAAQAYLRRFGTTKPAEVPDQVAYHWLSRGLKESLLEFIGRAGPQDALHVAIYEFHDLEVAQALKAALGRGVDVRIVYHAVDPDSKTVRESTEVLTHTGLLSRATARTEIKISHNKFVVLIVDGAPRAVWTGSSNFTEAGFYLQTNVGLEIADELTARAFEAYFQVLAGNPKMARKKKDQIAAQDLVEKVISSSPATLHGNPSSLYFSPVRSEHILDAAIELVRGAKSAILMSAPFGMDHRLVDAIQANDDRILEYGLANTAARKKVEALNRKNTRFFTPTRLHRYMGENWDGKAFGSHKIHAKTLIVDPWGEAPAVLIGSANFSEPSCRGNDENALLVRGSKRMAAILSVEFLRMFDHYKSRYFINQFFSDSSQEVRYLEEDGSWARTAFSPHSRSHKFRDRQVFAGEE